MVGSSATLSYDPLWQVLCVAPNAFEMILWLVQQWLEWAEHQGVIVDREDFRYYVQHALKTQPQARLVPLLESMCKLDFAPPAFDDFVKFADAAFSLDETVAAELHAELHAARCGWVGWKATIDQKLKLESAPIKWKVLRASLFEVLTLLLNWGVFECFCGRVIVIKQITKQRFPKSSCGILFLIIIGAPIARLCISPIEEREKEVQETWGTPMAKLGRGGSVQ